MKKLVFLLTLFFLGLKPLSAQTEKDKFLVVAPTASIDFGKHSSLGAGASLIIADRMGNTNLSHKDEFSNWVFTFKENFFFRKFNSNSLNAHQFAVEFHHFDFDPKGGDGLIDA